MEETKGERKGKEQAEKIEILKSVFNAWKSEKKMPIWNMSLRFGGKGKKHWEHLTFSIN